VVLVPCGVFQPQSTRIRLCQAQPCLCLHWRHLWQECGVKANKCCPASPSHADCRGELVDLLQYVGIKFDLYVLSKILEL